MEAPGDSARAYISSSGSAAFSIRQQSQVGAALLSRADSRIVVDAEHFQPSRVLLSSVPDGISPFNVSLLPITLGEID
jgi:hypothetical protein